MKKKRYYDDEILLRENEIGNLFYIVLQGKKKYQVFRLLNSYVLGGANCYTESDGSHVQVAMLKCGDFLGGKGLFNNLPSVATRGGPRQPTLGGCPEFL